MTKPLKYPKEYNNATFFPGVGYVNNCYDYDDVEPGEYKGESWWDRNNLLEETDEIEPFHITSTLSNKEPKPLACTQCGGTEFHIGDTGSFFGAVRCVKCKWECCFYDG